MAKRGKYFKVCWFKVGAGWQALTTALTEELASGLYYRLQNEKRAGHHADCLGLRLVMDGMTIDEAIYSAEAA